MNRTMARCTCLLLATLALACDKKEPTAVTEKTVEKNAASGLDPELAEAVAAASASAAPGSAPAPGAQGGPPPRGVFLPGGADAQILPEAPPEITVGSPGAEPRMRLSGGFGTKAAPLTTRVQVALQSGGQGALPIDFDMVFEEVASADQVASEGSAARREVRGRVTGAQAPPELGGRLPPELVNGLSKLSGSEVRFEIWPSGAATGFRTEAKQGTPQDLGDMLRALSDVIATAILPYPDQELGVGGFWMVTSRDGLMGLDLVTYRLIRVEAIAEGVATLQVSTKRYAASSDFSLAGLDGEFLLEELQAGGEGTLRYRTSASLPFLGRLQTTVAAVLLPQGAQAPGQPPQRGTLQLVSQARFSEK